MNRRQLVFILFVNALLSLVIALAVIWAVEQRRPDPEALSAFALLTTVPPQAALNLPPEDNAVQTVDSENSNNNDIPDDTLPDTPIPSAVPTQTLPVTQPPATPTPIPEDLAVYIVQGGDSLSAIATRFKISLPRLMEINRLVNPDFVFSGQRLLVPELEGGVDPNLLDAPIEPEVATPAAPQGIHITGIENPGDLANEAVLLVNESNQPVNLNGWTLDRAGGPRYTFESLPLFAGSGVRLYSKEGTNSTIARHWGQPESLWSTGMVVTLRDNQGQEMFQYVVP